MTFDPTSIVSLIQNCKKLYDYAADVKHSSAERSKLLEEVHSLELELEALHGLATTPRLADDPTSMERLAQLLDPAQSFAKVVDKTFDRIKDVLTYGTSNPDAHRFKVLGKRWAAALWWTVNKAEVKNLLSDLERCKSRIGLALQHDIFKKQDVMDVKQDVVVQHLSDENRLKIAEFISKHDYNGHRVDLSEKRLSGTGTWMLQHPDFLAWRDDTEQSPTTLWCYGHPGAGKSVMAALIVDELQSTPGNIVLSVFCRYSSDDFSTPFTVLRGLLRQLIERSNRVPSTICEQYWKGIHPTPNDLSDFLIEAAAVHTRPIYIVIDALDECKIALDLLCAIQQLGPSFRVLVTSRPVFNEIEKYPSIQIRASDHDILVAVDTILPKLKGTWLDDALKGTIRAKIVERADGMFLLASLQLRELERDVTCHRDVAAILDSLPRTLDDAYKLTFQRIRDQGERKKELACRTLAVVIAMPLWRDEYVQRLLAGGDETQYTDIDTILQCCHGLVCRAPDRVLEFIHYSVHEYTTTHWSELRVGYSALKRASFSIPLTAASHVGSFPTPVHRPPWYKDIIKYMIQTAPPDVQRFNKALRAFRGENWNMHDCNNYINARSDMRVDRRGVVVAVNPARGNLRRGLPVRALDTSSSSRSRSENMPFDKATLRERIRLGIDRY